MCVAAHFYLILNIKDLDKGANAYACLAFMEVVGGLYDTFYQGKWGVQLT